MKYSDTLQLNKIYLEWITISSNSITKNMIQLYEIVNILFDKIYNLKILSPETNLYIP